MEEFPTRLADLLESVTRKIRGLTVDRAAKVVRIISLGLPAAVLVVMAVIFLFLTIHGALAIPLTSAGAHGVIAGLFLIGAAFMWSRRNQSSS